MTKVSDSFVASAWLLFSDFKTDKGKKSANRTGSRKRSGYNPNQARGENGQWVQTGVSSKPEKETKPKIRTVPKDVKVEDLGDGGFSYTHTTKENNTLKVTIENFPDDGSKNVDFTVNDSVDLDSSLSTVERNRLSIKVAKIMQYDASKRKDGEEYVAFASSADSKEYSAVRTYAYEKIANFSRPIGGDPGAEQYGIVRNGKIVPNYIRLRAEEEEVMLLPSESEERAENYRRIATNYRRSQSR